MTLVFDYDGTLHNSIVLYGPAFRKAFQYLVETHPEAVIEAGYALDKQWENEEISEWLGYTKAEMWHSFMPHLSEVGREGAGKIIGDEMARLTLSSGAKLYHGVLETLIYLKKKGHTLVFLSNCGSAYMKRHKDLFHLDQLFSHFMCAEEFPNCSKAEILKSYIATNEIDKSTLVMIGDRRHDVEAGHRNGLLTVGCLYGYGQAVELERCDYRIESIKALQGLF